MWSNLLMDIYVRPPLDFVNWRILTPLMKIAFNWNCLFFNIEMESTFWVLFKTSTKDMSLTHLCTLISFVWKNCSIHILAHENLCELSTALWLKRNNIEITIRVSQNYFISYQIEKSILFVMPSYSLKGWGTYLKVH